MTTSTTASNRYPRWERPGLVRLATGADSEKNFTASKEFGTYAGPAS